MESCGAPEVRCVQKAQRHKPGCVRRICCLFSWKWKLSECLVKRQQGKLPKICLCGTLASIRIKRICVFLFGKLLRYSIKKGNLEQAGLLSGCRHCGTSLRTWVQSSKLIC